MGNVIHDLDVVIGKSRRGTERYFGHPDFAMSSFTAYQRADKLLILISGRNEDEIDKEETVKGYLLVLPGNETYPSEHVHLLDEQEVEKIKGLKRNEELADCGIAAHGNIGSGISQPTYLTANGTAVIMRVVGGEVVGCKEESIWKLFGRE